MLDGSLPIEWSAQQLEALDRICEWRERGTDPSFFLSGWAGTGKTTLARRAAKEIGGAVHFASVTGRACAVMAKKGCEPVDTLDRLLYRRQRVEYCADEPPCQKICTGRCRHKREAFDDKRIDPDTPLADADLVVLDEVSMLGRRMGQDLLSLGVPLLVLGDIGQLPAIGDAGYFTNRRPDFQLREIHRQAADSPIVRLAARARRGILLPVKAYGGDSAVVTRIADKQLIDFDQIIVGTHRRRRAVNKKVRKVLGFAGKLPNPGEAVVCLKNDRRNELRNGELFRAIAARSDGHGFVEMTVRDESGRTVDVVAPEAGFNGDGNGSDLPEQPFDFGHAITCHKAQGSEWGSVLVFDESAVFRGDAARWLYTAITRAADRVVVVQS